MISKGSATIIVLLLMQSIRNPSAAIDLHTFAGSGCSDFTTQNITTLSHVALVQLLMGI
jgi:hypothetical protein